MNSNEDTNHPIKTKKFLHTYGFILFLSSVLMFIIQHEYYTLYEMIEGMIFFSSVTLIYFILVHLFFRNEHGIRILSWSVFSLFVITLVALFFCEK